jgi:hypothetical protein
MAQALKDRPGEQQRSILNWPQAAVSVPSGAMLAVASHYGAPASRIVYTRQHLFDQLETEWHEGTMFSSSLSEIVAHPSYQRIIGMGRDALPLIFAALRRRADHWHWALRSITGENPVPSESNGDLEKTREAWLSWASNQYDSFTRD